MTIPSNDTNKSLPKPPWLKRRLPVAADYEKVRRRLKNDDLHTVCQEAHCPNIWECFSHQTATFLILGEKCTRNCRFCAVGSDPVEPPDPKEPERVAAAALGMGLTYIVVTSVTRDDLPDGGSEHFANTISQIKSKIPTAQIEVLIPDFEGDLKALHTVLNAGPSVLNHNLETVPRLYKKVRPEAIYTRSLELLNHAAEYRTDIPTKSGLMLGIGETDDEIRQALADLRAAKCKFLTLGQYLQPSKNHLHVDRYVTPDEFNDWADVAKQLGFKRVASGPLVRSSYHAKDMFLDEKA
jgi:lipoyl synthase